MIFANYARLSVFRDNSDSIKNQGRMSRDYADAHFPGQVDKFLNYIDEDYSGSNADRPDLKRLLDDVKHDRIDVLIVYQLDRLSRNIKDFSDIYSVLEQHKVQFISVKESIDTSTPIGKAMMYIIVIFAQMERETTANRVTDNMIGLVHDGWWVAGNPIAGYKRKRVLVNGKSHVTLEIIPEQVEWYVNLFKTFLGSRFTLSSFATYCKNNNIKTIRGNVFSDSQLYTLFANPCGVENTKEIYDYFKAKGCQMIGDPERWDGKNGLIVYGRTTERGKNHIGTSPDNWIVSPGRHKPIIDADLWLSAQKRFGHNKIDKSPKYDIPLLKGILRCGKCGRMLGMSRKVKKDGSVSTWYRCPKRNLGQCGLSEIKIRLLDDIVIDIFKEIVLDDQAIQKYMVVDESHKDEIKRISASIKNIDAKITRLTEALELADGSASIKYILPQIDKLDSEKNRLSDQLWALNAKEQKYNQSQHDSKISVAKINDLIKNFDVYTDIQRNAIAREVIKECSWDGETLKIVF